MSDDPQGAPAAPSPFAGEAAPTPGQVQGAETVAQLQNDPAFMEGLQSRTLRDRQPFLDRWAKAHQAAAGNPSEPTGLPQQQPSEDQGDGARLDFELSPKSPSEYTFSLPQGATADPGLGAFREQVFAAGINPTVANNLWKSLPAVEALSDDGYRSAVRAAASAVRGQPGGPETVSLAHATGERLMQQGRLWERAVCAAYTTPSGILELARIGRKASR